MTRPRPKSNVIPLQEHSVVPYLREISSELRELRNEVKRLQSTEPGNLLLKGKDEPICKISIDRAIGERKPYRLNVEGQISGNCKLSSMRTAIFLVLFLDLQDRLEHGAGIQNLITQIIDVYSQLDPSVERSEKTLSVVRVGLYRFELFLKETGLFRDSGTELYFDTVRSRLDLRYKHGELPRISSLFVTSSDPQILALIDSISKASPLTRIRKQKSMYISSFSQGWHQLFLEFFDHKHKIRNTSMFYRFSLPTYPDSLLKSIGAPPSALMRKAVMLKGYEENRIEFVEILSRQTLWDTITLSPRGGFQLYPKHIRKSQVQEHLEHILYQISQYPNYKLVLTDAPFPFIVSVMELQQDPAPELFSLFYRQVVTNAKTDWTCFILNDGPTTEGVRSNIIQAVLEHPSTVSDKDMVMEEVDSVLECFIADGPHEMISVAANE